MPINNSMNEQEINKDQKETSDPIDRVDMAIFDHILIVDKETGDQLVNKRG